MEGLARDGRARPLDCAAALLPAAAGGRHQRCEPRRLSRRRPGRRPLRAPGAARNRPRSPLCSGVDRVMTEILPPRPFFRQMYADRDDLVGARWWQESLQRSAPDRISRRNALLALALTLGPAAGGGLLAWLLSQSDEVDITMDALELQRREGWNVGHAGAALRFPNASAVDIDGGAGWRDALGRFALELAPAQATLAPFYAPTLFQSPAAPGSASLRAALTPLSPAPENRDVLRGAAIRSLFAGAQTTQDVAVILDVQGPTSVAVAAGMAPGFDPVFVLDNWPHPLGVVPSHLTLGAVLYYRPLFMRLRAERTGRAPPVFVLDRNRLARYTDEETQFDNRCLARRRISAGAQANHLLLAHPRRRRRHREAEALWLRPRFGAHIQVDGLHHRRPHRAQRLVRPRRFIGEQLMGKTFFGVQVVIKAFPVDSFRGRLHEIIARSSSEQSLVEKRAFWKRVTAVLDEQVSAFDYGFWDLIRGGRAGDECEEWSSEVEGAVATEKEELGDAPDEINRISADKRYVIATLIFLLEEGSNADMTLGERCDMPESEYFTRTTFGRLIGTIPMLNFANVEADAVYLIPGNDQDGLSDEDVHGGGYEYLK